MSWGGHCSYGSARHRRIEVLEAEETLAEVVARLEECVALEKFEPDMWENEEKDRTSPMRLLGGAAQGGSGHDVAQGGGSRAGAGPELCPSLSIES